LLKNPIFRTPFSMEVDRDTIVAHYVCYNVEMFSNTSKRSDVHKHKTPMHVTARRNTAQVVLHREHTLLNSANQEEPTKSFQAYETWTCFLSQVYIVFSCSNRLSSILITLRH
jgi:hypothetical protein